MKIYFVDNLLQLFIVNLKLSLIQRLSQLGNSYVSSLIFVHSHKHVSQLLYVLMIRHLHQQVHCRLFQSRNTSVLSQAGKDVRIKLIFLRAPNDPAFSILLCELIKPGISECLLCRNALLLVNY